jgi:hypothetical protein
LDPGSIPGDSTKTVYGELSKLPKTHKTSRKAYKACKFYDLQAFFMSLHFTDFSKVPEVFGANSGQFSTAAKIAPNLPRK